jgi:hypothetical protein
MKTSKAFNTEIAEDAEQIGHLCGLSDLPVEVF